MEQTENEFGIPHKEPEVKNEEQEAAGQRHRGEICGAEYVNELNEL